MTSSAETLKLVQRRIWEGSIPLEIRLATNDVASGLNDVGGYHCNCPRLSYLPLLLQRLHDFFSPYLKDQSTQKSQGWFSFEEVPLKWHYPIGLLYDVFAGASGHSISENNSFDNNTNHHSSTSTLPWRLELHFSAWPTEHFPHLDESGKVLRDMFNNTMKQGSFLRTGGGKVAMSLPMQSSLSLWQSVVDNDLAKFRSIQIKLVDPPGVPLRHIPLRVYLPLAAADEETDAEASLAPGDTAKVGKPSPQGRLRVLQTLITPQASARQPQTMGTALNIMLPTLFPSRRSPLLAQPVLHGAVVPLGAGLEDLAEYASYADGWLHVSIVMM